MSEEGYRPPAHPAGTAPSEYVDRASGDPSLLTDRERWLLMRLAIDNLMRQTGCDELTAAAALDHFARAGRVRHSRRPARRVRGGLRRRAHPRDPGVVALGRVPGRAPARRQLARLPLHRRR